MRRRPDHRGALLAETLVSLTLGLVVIVAFSGAIAGSLRWIASLWARAEALEVVRTVWIVLDEELRPGLPGRDWQVSPDGEFIALRAFRGLARVCEGEGSAWSVAYRGRREPQPGRDSLLVLGRDGGWRAVPLEAAGSGGFCSILAGESPQIWHWTQSLAPAPVLVRLYEWGELHLADGALRYRQGAGGRQPLTPERLGGESGFASGPEGVDVRVRIVPAPGSVAEDYVWTVRGTDTVSVSRFRP